MPPSRETIGDALRLLGVVAEFEAILTAPSIEAAQHALAELHRAADRAYKQKAREAHPDLGGSTEDMQALNAARDLVRDLNVRPRPVMTVVRVFYGYGFRTGTSTSTATNSWGY